MNNIEEMMKTAGVKPAYTYNIPDLIGVIEVDAGYIRRTRNKWSNNPRVKITKVNKYYPDFTAGKQLELIQLIASERGLLMKENALTVLNLKREKDIELCVDGCFVQGLAALVTNLMKAGELDKGKVKEILE